MNVNTAAEDNRTKAEEKANSPHPELQQETVHPGGEPQEVDKEPEVIQMDLSCWWADIKLSILV